MDKLASSGFMVVLPDLFLGKMVSKIVAGNSCRRHTGITVS